MINLRVSEEILQAVEISTRNLLFDMRAFGRFLLDTKGENIKIISPVADRRGVT